MGAAGLADVFRGHLLFHRAGAAPAAVPDPGGQVGLQPDGHRHLLVHLLSVHVEPADLCPGPAAGRGLGAGCGGDRHRRPVQWQHGIYWKYLLAAAY